MKEDEGLERFERSLTKLNEYENKIAVSKELKDLQELIADTNKKLSMRFKREHEYKLEKYEEQLYKEVMFDLRGDKGAEEDVNQANPLKKARMPTNIRNLDEFH